MQHVQNGSSMRGWAGLILQETDEPCLLPDGHFCTHFSSCHSSPIVADLEHHRQRCDQREAERHDQQGESHGDLPVYSAMRLPSHGIAMTKAGAHR